MSAYTEIETLEDGDLHSPSAMSAWDDESWISQLRMLRNSDFIRISDSSVLSRLQVMEPWHRGIIEIKEPASGHCSLLSAHC
jgi:hypothetical protein